MLAPRFDEHHGGDSHCPHEVVHPEGKSQQHQCPAAADAAPTLTGAAIENAPAILAGLRDPRRDRRRRLPRLLSRVHGRGREAGGGGQPSRPHTEADGERGGPRGGNRGGRNIPAGGGVTHPTSREERTNGNPTLLCPITLS